MKKFTLILSIFCMTVALSYAQGLIHFEKAKNEKANFATTLMVDVKQSVNSAKELVPVWQCDFEGAPTWTIGHEIGTKDWVVGDETSRPCYWGPVYDDGTGWYIFAMEYLYEDAGNYAYVDITGDALDASGYVTNNENNCVWEDGNGVYHFDAWIQFDNLDFSAVDIPSLKFHNSYRAGNPTFFDCFVEYSLDDGATWTTHRINTAAELDDMNFIYGEYELGLPNMANQANVTLRFRHTLHGWEEHEELTGFSKPFAWMLDNIRLYDYASGPAHDLKIEHTVINFFDYEDYTLPENIGYITYQISSYYGQIPAKQFTADNTFLWFNISLKNNGSAMVTPNVNVKVQDPANNIVFDEVVTGTPLGYSQADTLDMIEVDCDITNPIVGKYLVTYYAYSESEGNENEDVTPENNVDTAYFYISENTFSREAHDISDKMSAKHWTNGGADGDGIGAVFTILYSDTIRSIDVFIDEATDIGTMVGCQVYERDGANWESVLVLGEPIEIEESHRGQWLNMSSANEYILDLDIANGEIYRDLLIGIDCYYNGVDNNFYIGQSTANKHSAYSTYWRFPQAGNTWSPIGNHEAGPAIRLNYGTYYDVGVDAPLNIANQMSIYPNPSTGILNIEGIEGANVQIVNIMGQVVESIENANEFNAVDMSKHSNGTYFVKVVIGNDVTTTKINLIK